MRQTFLTKKFINSARDWGYWHNPKPIDAEITTQNYEKKL